MKLFSDFRGFKEDDGIVVLCIHGFPTSNYDWSKVFKLTKVGSCVLKASVDRVSVDTIGRYGDRHSADISTNTRPICRPRVGRVSVDMLF